MRQIQRVIELLVLSLIILISTSCNFVSNVIDAFDRKDRSKIARDIVEYFNNEDVEGLKDMFCDYKKDRHDLDEEITTAFEFLNGSFTDYKLNRSSEGSSVDEGRESYLQYTYNIEDISTDSDSDHIYIISYTYRERCFDYKETEGMTSMAVIRVPIDDKRNYDDYVEIGGGKTPRIAPKNSE